MDELFTGFDEFQSTISSFGGIPQSSEDFKRRIDAIGEKVDKLETKVNNVEEFFSSKSKIESVSKCSAPSGKEKDKGSKDKIAPSKKQQADASKREAAASKRMQELMRHMATIVRQMTQHKWAWPFMHPVDVKGLGLVDYFEVIEKPMDFLTIKNQMEAKDGSGYKNVRDVCADVRLVFKNAMKYNGVRTDVHVMARTLLEKFEEKWLSLLPKVTEEEKRKEEEEAEAQADMHIAQEAAHAKLAKELSNQLYDIDMHLDELREIAVLRCRKISTDEKRKLGIALTKLSPEDLTRALEIVAQYNPGFIANAEEVDLDIDEQSESTLWGLKFFVKKAFEAQAAAAGGGDDEKKAFGNVSLNGTKRKRDVGDAGFKNKKKTTKKVL